MKQLAKKILVVDDTEATRYAVARTLKAEGYSILEAANGQEALDLAFSEKPDLVTLDIHLPDILGFEVCRRIKSNPQTSSIPVLQVSASYVTSKDRIHGLEGGADSYLTHPFEPAVLVATIKSLLRTRMLSEELRQTEEKFRLALSNAPILIYTLDENFRFNWIFNPPSQLSADDVVGKTLGDLLPPEQAEELDAYQKRVFQNAKGERVVMSLSFAGVERWYDITLEPLKSDKGIAGLTVACVDITETMESQKAQKKALEEAELANQAKTRFLSNMSHEIRTPLGIVQGFADLAAEENISASDRNNYLTTIKRNATGLTKLLGEILDLAKVESGMIEVENSQFSFVDLIEEVVSAFSLQARERAIALQLQVQGTFPEMINSDTTRVRQILINLISNAIKFTEKGGVRLTVKAHVPETDPGPVLIEVSVRDTGIGLNPEQQRRLFQPFMQADSSTTRRFGGTGLGLNLSKHLSQSLGGDLVLSESKEGQGSTFVFTFNGGEVPLSQFTNRFQKPQDPVSEKIFSDGKNVLSGLRILLVEDSPDLQILCQRYLKMSGAVIDIANDGVEGVEKARKGLYDVILMDIQMPNLDGIDATRTLREEGYKIPIVALTAHALADERRKAHERGFTDYLTKPLNPQILIEMLKQFRKND